VHLKWRFTSVLDCDTQGDRKENGANASGVWEVYTPVLGIGASGTTWVCSRAGSSLSDPLRVGEVVALGLGGLIVLATGLQM